jgi:hypothetical protein
MKVREGMKMDGGQTSQRSSEDHAFLDTNHESTYGASGGNQ